MQELVSVIVPVYNSEKYINKCVISIVNQTYRDLEIILIDDGSDDNSGKICDDWKQKDNRIKVIHKKNGGLSDARNMGIENSVGSYLIFIDSDDYIDEDMVENLYNSIIKNNSQIAISGFIYQTYLKQEIRCSEECYVANSEEALRRLFEGNDMSQAIWDKIYKKELFNEIRFPIGELHEDVGTLWRLFDKADTISHINKAGYHYVQRNGSILHSKFDEKQLCIVKFREDTTKFVQQKYPNIINEAEEIFAKTLNNCIVVSYRNKFYKEYKMLKLKLKEYISRFLRNPKIKLGDKIKSVLIAYLGGSRLYKR